MQCGYCLRPLQTGQRDWCDERCERRGVLGARSILFFCPECKLELRVPVKPYKRKFCSRSCARSAYNRGHFSAHNNPNWRGGKVLSYGSGWKRIKQRVRERDKVCQNCGKTPAENGRALDVHHIKPRRFSGSNELGILVALCRSCHMRAEDHGRRGSAKFAGPIQLELRPPSQRELRRRRGAEQRAKRRRLKEEALKLYASKKSLRQIGRALGVSHQTIDNWLQAP